MWLVIFFQVGSLTPKDCNPSIPTDSLFSMIGAGIPFGESLRNRCSYSLLMFYYITSFWHIHDRSRLPHIAPGCTWALKGPPYRAPYVISVTCIFNRAPGRLTYFFGENFSFRPCSIVEYHVLHIHIYYKKLCRVRVRVTREVYSCESTWE